MFYKHRWVNIQQFNLFVIGLIIGEGKTKKLVNTKWV